MAVIGRLGSYGTDAPVRKDYISDAMQLVEDNGFRYRQERRMIAENIKNGISIDDIKKEYCKKNITPKGYYFESGKYVVRFDIDYKRYYLGRYSTIEEASSLYQQAIHLHNIGESFSHLVKGKNK